MESPRPIDDAAAPGEPGPIERITCAEASAACGAFASGGASASLASAMHVHLASCEPCRERYRAAVEATMAVLRARRTDRSVAYARPRSLATPMRVPKKLALVLALAVIAGIAALPSRGATRVRAIGGEVLLGKASIVPGDEPVTIAPGAFASTTSGASAGIERGGSHATAGASTTWSFEFGDELALRLLEGDLELEGDVRVVTALGVVECADGGAHVRLDGEVLDVESRAGRVTVTSAAECRDLVPGSRLTVDLGSLAAPVSSAPR